MRVKALLAHCVAKCRDRMLVISVVDPEPNGADIPSNFVCRAEEPCRVTMAHAVRGQPAKALEEVGDGQVRLVFCGAGERLVSVAFRLIWLTFGDRYASTRRQCPGQMPPR